MDILIKGMKMPPERTMLEVFPDGRVFEIHPNNNARTQTNATAIGLPPHGKLCDKDAVWDMLHNICVKCNDSGDIDRYPNRCVWCKIKDAYSAVYGSVPTILEASK